MQEEQKQPLTLEQKWNKRKNLLSFLAVVLAVSMILYFALGAVHLGLGLILFIVTLIFRPITG